MGIWRSLHALATGKKHKRTYEKRSLTDPRRMRRKALALEPLEERALLAILLSEVAADNGAPIVPGQVRDVAPRELAFRFDNAVDPNTLFGIQIVRSGTCGARRARPSIVRFVCSRCSSSSFDRPASVGTTPSS